MPMSESLAIIELSSQSSGEGKSESGTRGLDDDVDIRKGAILPETSSSGSSTDSSSMAAFTAIIRMLVTLKDYHRERNDIPLACRMKS